MNGEPQDSTTSSRPNVENLRSLSDYSLTSSRHHENPFPESRAGSQRDQHSDGDLRRGAMTSSSAGHLYTQPPRPYQQYGATTQFHLPQRRESLLPHHQQAREEIRRRAVSMMLGTRREQDEFVGAARRRAFEATSLQHPSLTTRIHAPLESSDLGRRRLYDGPIMENRPVLHPRPTRTSISPDEYILPRWQPDAEVTNCPICKHAFSFFYRKHHCRKCGRVVCANCSPHRITIPRQYTVNPPAIFPIEIDLTGDSPQEDDTTARLAANELYPGSSDGQEVRLCNPCVPDPHPSPSTPSFYADTIPRFGQPSQIPRVESYSNNRRASLGYTRYQGGAQSNSFTGRYDSTQPQTNPLNNTFASPYGSVPNTPTTYLPRPVQQSRPRRQHASVSALPTSRYGALFDAMTSLDAPLPPLPVHELPRRQIAEEDECPICHDELPPKGLNGSESEREAHVSSCIEGHFTTSHVGDSMAPNAATTAGAATARLVQAESGTPCLAGGPSARRRTTGMVIYNATEKDCMADEGGAQECIICFEDFESGTELGRLECLCKFHKVC